MRIILLIVALCSTAWGQAVKRTPAEAELAKQVKRAERFGFEKHDAKKYLALFSPDVTVVFGRGEKPGKYDFELSAAQHAALAQHRFSRVLSGKETVYFNDEKVAVKGDSGTYSAVKERHFFGGVEAYYTRYSAKKTADGWRVHAVRSWPVNQHIGGEPRMFDEGTYGELDNMVEDAKGGAFIERFTALVNARRFTEARALAEEETQKNPKSPLAWAAFSSVLVDLGEIESAKVAAKAAKKLDKSITTPFDK